MSKVVFVDIPTYKVKIPQRYRQLLLSRLKLESQIYIQQLGFMPIRPMLTYSRGLLTVATSVQNEGHDVVYIVYSDKADRSRLQTFIKEADVLSVSVITPTVDIASDICQSAKSTNPSIKCIIGGPHVKALPQETMERKPYFDIAVSGPGEVLLPQLLKNLDDPSLVHCTTFRSSEGTIENSSFHNITPPLIDIYPDYKLLYRPASCYAHNIQTQDGCPYECDFCVEGSSWQGGCKTRTIQSVIDEMRYLHNSCKHNTLIHFSDGIFNLNKHRTYELCNRLRNFSDKLLFSIDTRPSYIDQQSVAMMREAGIAFFRLGFEDAEDNILNALHKEASHTLAIESAKLIRMVAPCSIIHAYWISGLPGTSQESLMKNALLIRELIREKIVDKVANKIFVPYPGTPCYRAPENYNIQLLHTDWSCFDRFSFPVYRLNEISESEIYFGFLFSESIQYQACENRLGGISSESCSCIDYLYDSYISD